MDSKLQKNAFLCLIALAFCNPFAVWNTRVVAGERFVFCHYMLWTPLYNDTLEGFKQEIQLAQSSGIDAFVLNTMVWSSVYQNRAHMIYQAAEDLNFKIFFSADFNNGSELTAGNVRDMLTTYKNYSSQFYYEGKQLLSTFRGENMDNATSFWRDDVLDPVGNVFFLPFFATDGSENDISAKLDLYGSIVDGLFAWDTSAWPYVGGNYNTPNDSNDKAYLAACGNAGKVYMASVSPWFFTHSESCGSSCGDSCTCNSNQVKGNYQGASLWMDRWKQLVQSNVTLVEIVSWNDWSERHYVTPVGTSWGPVDTGSNPPAWNDTGFPHTAFLNLGAHFIQWYKTGQEPVVAKDELYMFYYTHSKNAIASNDSVGTVQHANVLEDNLYVVVKLTDPATVSLSSGTATQNFSQGAGLSSMNMSFEVGQQQATVMRNGVTVLSLVGDMPISNDIIRYDFNVYTKFDIASS